MPSVEDPDVRAFKFALTYDCVFLLLAASAWVWLIRVKREDTFRPNPRFRRRDSVESTEEAKVCCCALMSRDHWLIQLWKWNIADFKSTDVYLYLLFHRYCGLLFGLISLLTVCVLFPVIWTASPTQTILPDGEIQDKSFFERSVMTNVNANDYARIWVLYASVWTVMILVAYTGWAYYSRVRSDEFRSAVMVTRRRRHSNQAQRFLPSKYSICIGGLDRHKADDKDLRKALLYFFEPQEIVSVKVIMDYSEALQAHVRFEKALQKLLSYRIKHFPEEYAEPHTVTNSSWGFKYWLNPFKWGRHEELSGANTVLLKIRSTLGTISEGDVPPGNHRIVIHSPSSLDDFIPKPEDAEQMSGSSHVLSDLPGKEQPDSDSDDSLDDDMEEEHTSISDLLPSTPSSSTTRKSPINVTPHSRCASSADRLLRMAESRVSCVWENAGHGELPPDLRDKWLAFSANKSDYRRPRKKISACSRDTDAAHIMTAMEETVFLLYTRLQTLRQQKPLKTVGKAFVAFAHPEAARYALTHDFSHPRCPVFRAANNPQTFAPVTCPGCNINRREEDCRCCGWNTKWEIREAAPPEDIAWDNLHIPEWKRTARIIVVNLLIFILTFILTSSAMFTDALVPFAQTVESMISKASFLRLSVSGWLAPLILYAVNALLLPIMVGTGADYCRFWRYSARARAVLYGNVNYMVLNSLIFPVLGSTSIQTVFVLVYHTQVSDLFTSLGHRIAGASGSFFCRYILNLVFINSAMQMLQLPMFSQQRVMAKLGKRPRRWDFDFGYWFAFHLSCLSVALVFSVEVPLVPVLGCCFFVAKFWVDKYNFAFHVWRTPSESVGAIASSAVSFFFYFLSLFTFVMGCYFITMGIRADTFEDHSRLRRKLLLVLPSSRQPKCIAIGGIMLLVASLLIMCITVAEKAQRSLVDHHAGKLRRFLHDAQTWAARELAAWGVTSPQRGVLDVETADAAISGQQRLDLQDAYSHPFSRYRGRE